MNLIRIQSRTGVSRTVGALAVLGLLCALHGGPVEAEPSVEPVTQRLAQANVDRGKELFLQCSVCHVIAPGAETTIGPNLWNVVGRQIATAAEFNYSDSLRQIDGNWDFERLNIYLFDPRRLAPEGRMPFAGIKSVDERANLIAYLVSLSDDPVALPVTTNNETGHADKAGLDKGTSDNSFKWDGLPVGPGREEVFYLCSACHSLMIVKQQGLSRAAWQESLDWMVEEQGMTPIEDEAARDRILDYLSAHYGLK